MVTLSPRLLSKLRLGTISLKSIFNVSASSSLFVILLLLYFNVMNSLWNFFLEKIGLLFFQNCSIPCSNCIVPGFELAIHQLQFADQICLFADHFKQFLRNLGIKFFLLLELLSLGKPQSFCLHFKLNKSLISYSKKC